MSKDARECHTIPYYVTHVQFHPILCYIISISLMRNVRSRKAKRGRKGGRGRGGGGGPRAREGVSYYHILSPKPPLSFQQQSIISLCRLGEKKDLFPICNHPTKGMTGKSTEKIPLFPRLKVWQFSSTCSE